MSKPLDYRSPPYTPYRPRSRSKPMALFSLLISGIALGLCVAGSIIYSRNQSGASVAFLAMGVLISLSLGLPIACLALIPRGSKRFALLAVCANLISLVASVMLAVRVFEFLS